MIQDIMTAAQTFAGKELTEAEASALSAFSEAAAAEWSRRLCEAVTPEACSAAFVPACAFTALSQLMAGWDAAVPPLSFTAGNISVKQSSENRHAIAQTLRKQAETLMQPYITDDGFAVRGVRG